MIDVMIFIFGNKVIFAIVLVLQFSLPLIAAFYLNKKKGTERSFIWGYYQSFFAIFQFIVSLILVIVHFPRGENIGDPDFAGLVFTFPYLLGTSILILPAIFTLKRHKWALILLTAVSFNVFLWIINAFYIHDYYQVKKADSE